LEGKRILLLTISSAAAALGVREKFLVHLLKSGIGFVVVVGPPVVAGQK
jgi:hypothetical protein